MNVFLPGEYHWYSVDFNSHFRPVAEMGKKHNSVLLDRKFDARTSETARNRSVTDLMSLKMHRLPAQLQIALENGPIRYAPLPKRRSRHPKYVCTICFIKGFPL